MLFLIISLITRKIPFQSFYILLSLLCVRTRYELQSLRTRLKKKNNNNIKAYDMLVKEAPNVEGSKWVNHEEFVAQAVSDVLGEILSFYYLVPLFGLNKTSVT